MFNNKKPGEPSEPELRVEEFELSRSNGRFIVRINGIVIPEIQNCIVAQNSDGTTCIRLDLTVQSEIAKVTTKSY